MGLVTQDESWPAQTEQFRVNSIDQDKWREALHVNGAVVTFKLDTGAKANLVNES